MSEKKSTGYDENNGGFWKDNRQATPLSQTEEDTWSSTDSPILGSQSSSVSEALARISSIMADLERKKNR